MSIGSRLTSVSDFLFRSLFKVLFRYDVFISYARRDGKEYALKLRDQLRALDFSCFLDYDELPAGNSLNKTLKRAIRKSATLVVVGTERAIKSRYVELEIAEFAKTTRAIIPIDIAGTLADPPEPRVKVGAVTRRRCHALRRYLGAIQSIPSEPSSVEQGKSVPRAQQRGAGFRLPPPRTSAKARPNRLRSPMGRAVGRGEQQ